MGAEPEKCIGKFVEGEWPRAPGGRRNGEMRPVGGSLTGRMDETLQYRRAYTYGKRPKNRLLY